MRVNLPELRQRIPKRYPIRFYPDITHSRQREFTVHDWDVAYAQTEEREGINPRPLDQAQIFRVPAALRRRRLPDLLRRLQRRCEQGRLERARLGPEADVTDVLRDYGRYFIGPDMAGRLRPGTARAGAQLARSAADECRGGRHPRAVPGPGAPAPRRN